MTPEQPKRESFDDLFRRHHGRLVDALSLVSGDREAAADAVQEAFMKAHLKWRKISKYDDPIGWVRRVAINKLKDEAKRDRRKRVAVERLTQSTKRRPSADAARFDDGAMEHLLKLPRQQRLCVALDYVDGLDTKGIAQTLDIAEGSVRSNLHDGRKRLRTDLGLDASKSEETW